MSDLRKDPEPCMCGLAPEGRSTTAYNEEAFRYFLEIEWKRSEGSRRPFLLLLVHLKRQRRTSWRISPHVAVELFSRLSRSLRETDFVGWYREERIAGAVLTQRSDMPSTDAAERVAERVREALRAHLHSDVANRFRVRVCQVPPMPEREYASGEGQY